MMQKKNSYLPIIIGVSALYFLTRKSEEEKPVGTIGFRSDKLIPIYKKWIRKLEGFRERPYRDGNAWAIGYGHVISTKKVVPTQAISRELAEKYLDQDLYFLTTLNRKLPELRLTVGQKLAIVLLVYNIGVQNFFQSSMYTKLFSNKIDEAGKVIGDFIYVRGADNKMYPSEGLKNRRKIEEDLYYGRIQP